MATENLAPRKSRARAKQIRGETKQIATEEELPLSLCNSQFSDLDADEDMSFWGKLKNFRIVFWNRTANCAKEVKRVITVAIKHYRGLEPIPVMEKDELFYAAEIVVLEVVMEIIKKSTAAASISSIPMPIRRMGQHQQVGPTQGLFFLIGLNIVVAGRNAELLWKHGAGDFTLWQFALHWIYAILAVYCATIEVLDITVGNFAEKYFPFESFPLVVSIGILLLLSLEIVWKMFKTEGPRPLAIAAATPPLETVAPSVPSTSGGGGAATSLRKRGVSSSSSSSGGDATTATSSLDTAAKYKLKKRESRNEKEVNVEEEF